MDGDALTETSAMKQSFDVDHTDHTLTVTVFQAASPSFPTPYVPEQQPTSTRCRQSKNACLSFLLYIMFELPLLHSKYFSVLSLVRLLIGELNKNKPTPSLIKIKKNSYTKVPSRLLRSSYIVLRPYKCTH